MDFNTWELERWLGLEDLICLGINRPLFFPKPSGYQAPPGSLLQAAGSLEAQDLPTSTAAVRASTASTRASLCSMPAATTEVGPTFTSAPEKRHQVVVVEKKKKRGRKLCLPTTGWQHLLSTQGSPSLHFDTQRGEWCQVHQVHPKSSWTAVSRDADTFSSERTEVPIKAALSNKMKLIDIIVGFN